MVKYGAIPAASCSDSARNYERATRENEFGTFQTATGLKILRIECGIHTAHLILDDLISKDPEFAEFKKNIESLCVYLRRKDIKVQSREALVIGKIPTVQNIKWLTYNEASTFIIKIRKSSIRL